MARSLSLGLYRLAAQRGGAEVPEVPAPPAGRGLVWLHAPRPGSDDDADLRGLGTLAARLAGSRPQTALVLTHARGQTVQVGRTPPGLALHAVPETDPAWARAAMARWDPAVVVLGPGPLSPAILTAAAQAERPVIVLGGRLPEVAGRWGAVPGLLRSLLRLPRRVLVRDATCARAHVRAGAPQDRVEIVGPLARLPGPLPHTPAERMALARRFGARPLWLAACVPEAEEAAVLAAQRIAQRLAHRLLLVLVPTDPGRGAALEAAAAAEGLRAVRRATDDEPDDDTQVYIADTEGELGLWYRLAPVTFCGGTLVGVEPGAPGVACDPLEIAALGSAAIHGPAAMAEVPDYARLVRARASWGVPALAAAGGAGGLSPGLLRGSFARRRAATAADAAEVTARALADAVIALLAPERAARLARAGWDVATAGAEATDRAVELILDALEAAPGAAPQPGARPAPRPAARADAGAAPGGDRP
ncbi:MAG: glycosyltransferase N-terminal domain-containing protein [Alkalilacustris sp.]